MSQNLVSTHLTAEQWATTDAAISTLEQVFGGTLVTLSREERQRVIKMGDGSEAFCRKALDVMTDNPAVLPRNLDVTEMRLDLATHDALNARVVRLTRIMEKVNDTEMALGSDVMAAALEGYAFLKIAGKGEGLHGLRKTLSKRFDTGPRHVDPVTPAGSTPE